MKPNKRKSEVWILPGLEALKFNLDGLARGKPGPAGIGGVLRDYRGKVLCLFLICVGSQDSNTDELMAIEKTCSLCASNSILKGRDIDIVSNYKTGVVD